MHNNPHVVLVSGEWTRPSTFDELVGRLESAVFEASAVALPSVGSTTPHSDHHQDTAAVRIQLEP